MKRLLAPLVLVLVIPASFGGQEPAPPRDVTQPAPVVAPPVPTSNITQAESSAPAEPAKDITIPAGKGLVLELKDPINTRKTKKGDRVSLTTTDDLLVDDRVAVPRGSTVNATVVESKRAGRLVGKARVRLDFNEIVLGDGTRLPLAAKLSRAGWWQPSGKIEQSVKGEGGKSHDASQITRGAIEGAILGGLAGGVKGMGQGAAGGAIIALAIGMLQRGPDLDLPPGMMFEIETTKPVDVPRASVEAMQLAMMQSAPPAVAPATPAAGSAPPPAPADGTASPPGQTPSSGANPPAATNPPTGAPPASPGSTEPALARREDSPTREVPAPAQAPVTPPPADHPPANPPPARVESRGGAFTLKVDVNLVLVEATVRDQRGQLINNLTQNDFRIYEDGVEQKIQYFSRDELPLAVALVVDRSGSIAPYLSELRAAALETLSQLKPEDQVALFSFAFSPERMEYLTTDRQLIAHDIGHIQPGGGTNLADALFEPTLYLGRAAHGRRHAVILVSDNIPTVQGYASTNQVIRTALETETVIYSIRIGGGPAFGVPVWLPGRPSVAKICRETGGEVVDAPDTGSLRKALADVISRLKQRYTLGYQSTNARHDGCFRHIDVRLAPGAVPAEAHYIIYARSGYYAPIQHAADLPQAHTQTKTP